MARVNLDGKIWRDPRVKRLTIHRAVSLRETVGTLAAIWDVAIDSHSAIMLAVDVDAAAEASGYSADLVTFGLAEDLGDRVRLRGVEERIAFLKTQAERGRLGGIQKAANAKQPPSTPLATAKRPLEPRLALPLATSALDLDKDIDKDKNPIFPFFSPSDTSVTVAITPPVKRSRKPVAKESPELAGAIETVLKKLSERTLRPFGASSVHRAMVARLLTTKDPDTGKPYTVWDLRRVIAYCGSDLEWDTKPEMRAYMKPDTLFRPRAFPERLANAKLAYPGPDPDLDQNGNPRDQ